MANQAQYLLINTTSVDWLVQKVTDWDTMNIESPMSNLESAIERFRGNFIIQSPTALEELTWSSMNIGNIRFIAEGPCTRCQMICIDQRTGEKTTEPLRTISREFQGKVKFGVYLSHWPADDIEVNVDCNDDIVVSYNK